MPTEKRARKRAARQARMEAAERKKRRRSTIRRTVLIVVLAGLAIGIYAVTRSSGSKNTSAQTKGSTTASVTTTTVSLAGDTTSANCPTPFTAETKLKKPSFSSPPPMIIDPSKSYTATIDTDVGTFTIALDAKDAPKTVNNFVFLAENHFYDCVVFHRVIPSFMNQTGDPTGTGEGGPGYQFADENQPKSYTTGEVAMANSGPNTNGSQFFVLAAPYTPPPPESGQTQDLYNLFGHVTSGQSVVDKINADGTSGGTPKVLHRMVSVQISES